MTTHQVACRNYRRSADVLRMSDACVLEEPPRVSPEILQRNLRALAGVDPALAAKIEDAQPSALGWSLTTTRDGRPGFVRAGADGGSRWLGRSSIPTVRAAALLERFDPGAANVLLPGMGEGTEAKRLLDKIGRHRAVFVWEESDVELQLALNLHDFHEAIADERLVLLHCCFENVGSALSDWLGDHPGHLCPERVLMWPWQRPMDLGELRNTTESALRRVQAERDHELARLRQDWQARPVKTGLLEISAVHAREETWSRSEELAAAAGEMNWEVRQCLIRGPGDMHPLARARRLARSSHRAQHTIFLEMFRPAAGEMLPEDARAVTWFSGLSGLPADLTTQLGPADSLAVTTPRLHRLALQTNIRPDRLHIVPPACPSAALNGSTSWRQRSKHVILCDITSTEPGTYGVTLPSHVHLWSTAITLIQTRIDSLQDGMIDHLLIEAEHKAGVELTETTIRPAILGALRVAAQSLMCRSLVSALRQAGIPMEAFGRGWVEQESETGHPLTPSRRIECCQFARVVLHLDLPGDRTSEALVAAASGAVLIARRSDSDQEPGGLATLLSLGEEYLAFGTRPELLAVLKRLTKEPQLGPRIAQRAQDRCRGDHTYGRRLESLRTILTS